MPFTTYTRSVAATLVVLTSLVAFAQTGATKVQTVILMIKGENHVLRTSALTVSQLLQEQKLTLTEDQKISVPLTAPLSEGMQVSIESKSPANAPKVAPTPMKVVAPAKKETAASRGALSSRGTLGSLSRYEGKRVLTLTATGYGPGENGQWGDRTFMNTRVRYGVVAVDPRVIKLGTRLYVEGYGECRAEDTGGAIKGMRIDLAFNSDRVANQYGRRKVRVVILD
ncbi:3D domain-containing protein [Armatimonas sp.]|uniref:3D domain-containing protein n=1 Tax=Armatimonas sp. TaxID=1872638 RepID=UPI00286C9EEF|nr:3D domain-containing protein [Armatimonas sp.]